MRRLLLVSALLACPVSALADPPAGQIDPTFGDFDGGVLGLQLEGLDVGGQYNDIVLGMAADSQGRLLVAGSGEVDGGKCLGLMRFTPDGQLDESDFGYNQNNVAKGKTCHPFPRVTGSPDRTMDVVPLDDGAFLVAGVTNEDEPFICRLFENGRQDENFGSNKGCFDLPISASMGTPTLLVSGNSLLIVWNDGEDSKYVPTLSRFDLQTADPQPFNGTNSLSLLSTDGHAVAWDASLTADGDLVIIGSIEEDIDDQDAFIARFDMQGLVPATGFSGDGMVRLKINKVPKGYNSLSTMTVLRNGNILAAGHTELADRRGITVVQVDQATGVMEPLFNDGLPKTLDPCSDIDGGCNFAFVNSIGAADHDIILAGEAGGIFATRLHANGQPDSAFGEGGFARLDFSSAAKGMVLQDDRIVLAGSVVNGDSFDFGVLRLSGGRLFKDQFEAATP